MKSRSFRDEELWGIPGAMILICFGQKSRELYCIVVVCCWIVLWLQWQSQTIHPSIYYGPESVMCTCLVFVGEVIAKGARRQDAGRMYHICHIYQNYQSFIPRARQNLHAVRMTCQDSVAAEHRWHRLKVTVRCQEHWGDGNVASPSMSPSAGLVAMFGVFGCLHCRWKLGCTYVGRWRFFGPEDAKSLGRHKDEIGRA